MDLEILRELQPSNRMYKDYVGRLEKYKNEFKSLSPKEKA